VIALSAVQNGESIEPALAAVSLHEPMAVRPTYAVSVLVAQWPSARQTPEPIPLAWHWLSLVQATHALVEASQIGLLVAGQSALFAHSPQAPLSRHTGLAGSREAHADGAAAL
jgi:hypothetical protein